ncbi:MAG: glutamate--tRNA ligase [Psychroflexus maritimus]
MENKVRVRFAPSPTGPLHIGGVRTALYNYLFAKKHQGDFILRIEDTDQTRYVEKAEDYIIESLNWCGIPYDEGPAKPGNFGPYKQSERKEIYQKYIQVLLDKGHAYYAFDTPSELDALRQKAEQKGEKFSYGPANRNELNNSLHFSENEVKKRIQAQDYVVRFKTPVNKTMNIKDEVRGYIEVQTDNLDDKILFKSDGMPTYHLANIVDDHLMEISHVIRGEEWLPSLPLHVLLYEAFGWEAPSFAHLPLILKPNGKGKLSKRDGDKDGFPVFPLQWKDPKTGSLSSGYREEHYLPETLVNVLAFLGWNPGTEQELFSLKELIQAFDLKKVNKAGAKFDPKKTLWFQQQYLQKVPIEYLLKEFLNELESMDIHPAQAYVEEVIQTVKERAVFVSDLWELSSFYFEAPKDFAQKASKKVWKEDTEVVMKKLIEVISEVDDFSEENLKEEVKPWIADSGYGFGKVMQPLRLSLVGDMKGPDVFHILACIGKNEAVKRINFAIKSLGLA